MKDSNDGGAAIGIVERGSSSKSATSSSVKVNKPNVFTGKEDVDCEPSKESRMTQSSSSSSSSRACKTGKSPSFVQPMTCDQDPGAGRTTSGRAQPGSCRFPTVARRSPCASCSACPTSPVRPITGWNAMQTTRGRTASRLQAKSGRAVLQPAQEEEDAHAVHPNQDALWGTHHKQRSGQAHSHRTEFHDAMPHRQSIDPGV